MITAGVTPLVSLRVGMRFDSPADLPHRSIVELHPAILLDAAEEPWQMFYAHNAAFTGVDEGRWPMTLLYIPAGYTGPVDNGPEWPVGGTESAGGQVVAGTDTPTQEGYRQMMRQKSMAAHPAGKRRGSLYLGDSGAAL